MRLNWMEERKMKKNTKAARRMVRVAGAMTVIASAISVPLMTSAPAQAYAGELPAAPPCRNTAR